MSYIGVHSQKLVGNRGSLRCPRRPRVLVVAPVGVPYANCVFFLAPVELPSHSFSLVVRIVPRGTREARYCRAVTAIVYTSRAACPLSLRMDPVASGLPLGPGRPWSMWRLVAVSLLREREGDRRDLIKFDPPRMNDCVCLRYFTDRLVMAHMISLREI